MASLSWLSCSGPNPDDGPCGFAGGPNQSNTLSYLAIVDEAQTLKVELGAGAKGECGASASFWLDSSGTLAPRPANATPDYGAAQFDGTSTYTALGQTVQLVRVDATSVRVTFVNPPHAALTCSTPEGKTVTCN